MIIIHYVLLVYWIILFIRVLSSWFRVPPSGPIRSLLGFVYSVTEPLMRPLRNMLPPVRIGGMGLDLSPIILFVVIGILLEIF